MMVKTKKAIMTNFTSGMAPAGALLGTALLSACGASSNSAPIVYGTNPGATARVYNSPADVYLAQQAQPQKVSQNDVPQASYDTYAGGDRAGIRATPNSRPVSLTPVTQSAYQEPSYQPAAYEQPAYVAETAPVNAPAQSYQAAFAQPRSQNLSDGAVTVRPGDTVYAIARRTGVSPQGIIAQNRLAPPYSLKIGQVLYVNGAPAKIDNRQAAYQPSARTISASAPSRVADHIVRQGDTLYSISRASGLSVSAIAQANNLYPPYQLSVGDRLTLPGAGSFAAAPAPTARALTREVSYSAPAPAKPRASVFAWPVKGAIIGNYGAGVLGQRNDGINIAAPVGTPVRAAADGEVVYRGSELDGYGNLLLIKHSDNFVTAYAHNDVMLVRKGQKVRQGQVVAKVGQTGSAPEPQLHFEIRQNLKAVDPLALLDR